MLSATEACGLTLTVVQNGHVRDSNDSVDFLVGVSEQRKIPSFQSRKRPHELEGTEALILYTKTLSKGLKPSLSITNAALKACTTSRDLETGMKIHAHMNDSRIRINIVVATTLVHMYAKCGSMTQAREVFDSIHQHDLVSWNAMIFAYVNCGEGESALELFMRMQREGFPPNPRTYVAVLKACASFAMNEEYKQVGSKIFKVQSLEKCMVIHSQLAKRGYEFDIFVANTMMDVYAKCGSMQHALRVLGNMAHHDLVSWNTLIFGYTEIENGETALHLFEYMQCEGFAPNDRTYVAAFKACANNATREGAHRVEDRDIKVQSLEKCMAIHSQLAKSGYEFDKFVANTMMDLYAICGSMEHACWIFNKMPQHDLVSWNTIIFGYVECGHGEYALHLFAHMQAKGFMPNPQTYVAALQACASCAAKEDAKQVEDKFVKIQSLEKGISVHSQLAKNGYDSDMFVANTMMDFYAKCGSMQHAHWVFNRIPSLLVSWNSLIFGYVESGEDEDALQIFACMQEGGFKPNDRTYVAALKGCANCAAKEVSKQVKDKHVKVQSLEKGMSIHSRLLKIGYESDIFVANTIVDMYAKCGSMDHACQIFDKMDQHDIVSWNALIFGYVESGACEYALKSFASMQAEGFTPNSQTYVAALKACASSAAREIGKQIEGKLVKIESLEKGMVIHSHLKKSMYESDIFPASAVVDMYCKCGSMEHARQVLDTMPRHDLVLLNAMIFGYAESHERECAFQLFTLLQVAGFLPLARTYMAVLKACANCAENEVGTQVDGKLMKVQCLEKVLSVHSQLVKGGYGSDIFVANAILDVYSRCGSMEHTHWIFDSMPEHDLVSWNTMISGYAESAEECSFQLYACMQDKGFVPNNRTYLAVLKACSTCVSKEDGKQVEGKLIRIESLEKGISIHSQLAKSGYELDIFVASTLVDIYSKCGSVLHARCIFDKMPSHDLVSWNAIIFGYAENEESIAALQIFRHMQDEGFMPDALTYVAALKACGSLVALKAGRELQVQINNYGLQNEPVIAACLVGFFGKCGSMLDAEESFGSLNTRDLVTWNALLTGYAHHGDSRRVFALFRKMQEDSIQADGITFVTILHACSHAGLLDEAKQYFSLMCLHYLITTAIEHYACMVDLLGRGNLLDDAMKLVKNMPFEPNWTIWMTVLGACWKWKNVVIGRHAFECVLIFDTKDASAYVSMANIYAVCGMWEESAKVHAMRIEARAWKKPGQSCWTDDNGTVHKFMVGDTSHHQIKDIEAKLQDVLVKMKKEGYVPDLDSVLQDISDDQKESALCGHSERLAMGCALVNTAPGTPIRVVKNLRVCNDCHKSISLISKIEQRVVICRDATRFHVFEHGRCSCGDFW